MSRDIPQEIVKKPFWKHLYFWVIVGITCGVVLGHYFPETGQAMKPIGDGFIKMIKMIIAPVIFCTIVLGITGMNSLAGVGRVGLKALIYFEVMTTVALIIGLVTSNVLKPGDGMNIDPDTLDAGSVSSYAEKAQSQSVADFVLHIVPDTFVSAFTDGDILQVVFISVLFAIGLLGLGERSKPVLDFIHMISDTLFRVIAIIVRLAPIGAFGAMAFTVGKYGIESLGPLVNLMLVFYLTCAVFVVVALGIVMRIIGLSLWSLLKYLKEELLIVLGTSSSEPALPRLIEKMRNAGCAPSVVGMVVPTGYSFNLDGTCIYLTMAALFIAQAINMPLDLGQQVVLLLVLLLTSKGAAGVTGSGFVVLAATISTVGHMPVAGLALILGIDRFMSEARAITNFIGNSVATLAVAKWENALDVERAKAAMQQS
jgi:aerobic C4-dicarboxylate transport protein